MTVTPTSSAALIASAVIDLIAKSETFQDRCATYHDEDASEANARTHIYGFDVWTPDEDLKDLRPFALVGSPEQALKAVVNCSALQYLPTGSVVFVLVDDARYTDCFGDDPADDAKDSWIDALNWIHGTLDDMQGIAVADVAFRPDSIESVEPVQRPSPNDRQSDDFWRGMFSATFGEGS